MENKNLQHVQVPNGMTLDVKPRDLLVYATIKRHQNKDTKKAYPSLIVISSESGLSINTIRDSISRLEKHNYITIEKKSNKNIYSFNQYKEFEPFSYEFLDNKELTPDQKSYILATQQYMYKDIKGEGVISYTNQELADKINISESSIIRYNNSLERNGFLTKVQSKIKDMETGCYKEIKIFNLNKMLQQIVWVLKNHEDRITNNEKEIEAIKHENKLLKEEIEKLKQKESYKFIM